MRKYKSYIVARIKGGDYHLFESVYMENYHSLIDYAQRFVFSKENARDIIQDTFIRIWEVRRSLPEDIHFRSYLFTAVRNRCLDFLKHQTQVNRYVQLRVKELEETGFQKKKQPEDPLEALISKELQKKIIDTIDALPPRCREIFILSRFEGMKYKEISEKLNISVKTIETHMTRTLLALRDALHDEYPGFTDKK